MTCSLFSYCISAVSYPKRDAQYFLVLFVFWNFLDTWLSCLGHSDSDKIMLYHTESTIHRSSSLILNFGLRNTHISYCLWFVSSLNFLSFLKFCAQCDRNLSVQSNIFRSHSDGIFDFSVWGQDLVSVSRNKIALTSLSRPTSEVCTFSSWPHSPPRYFANLPFFFFENGKLYYLEQQCSLFWNFTYHMNCKSTLFLPK